MVLSLTRAGAWLSLVPKVAALPLIIEVMTEGKKVVICHADYPHNEYAYDKPVDAEQVIWNRERVSAAQDGIVNEISGADLFIFGHTPRASLKYANQMYIDTGAVFCGRLTLVQIQGGDHA
jgi:serine/threonine protein phosphatase 1